MPSALHKVQKSISKKRNSKKGKSASLSALHENSRDAQRIRRAAARDDKVAKHIVARERINERFLNRLAFLHSATKTSIHFDKQLGLEPGRPVDPSASDRDGTDPTADDDQVTDGDINMANQDASSTTLTPVQIEKQNFEAEKLHQLIRTYLDKHDLKIKHLESERRKGRPKSTEHTRAERERELEKSEYDSGFWMPDLRDPVVKENFATWDGKWEALGPFRYVRVRRRVEGEEFRETVKAGKFPPSGSE